MVVRNTQGQLSFPGTGFTSSCYSIRLSGTYMSSTCKDSSSRIYTSSINLNTIITNSCGSLRGVTGCTASGTKSSPTCTTGQTGGFAYSCDSFQFSAATGVLRAYCRKCNGSYQWSSITLNSILSNKQGQFYFPGASFLNSCSQVTLSDTTLKGTCRNSDGAAVNTMVGLNALIGNSCGKLVAASGCSLSGYSPP
ncbi:Cyanovirin-N [Hyaloraphidium curvatum]|nr:Cyanovirin-N [Hyaloraphidium curvatum]